MEWIKLNLYKYCMFDNVKKDGYCINKCDKLQSFKCLECVHKFTPNFGFKKNQRQTLYYCRWGKI